MATSAGHDFALAHRANLNIAAAVVARLGTGASDSLIANVINDVRASYPVAELASPGGMAGVVGAVETAIARNSEAGRPRNIRSAEMARLEQLGAHGAANLLRHGGQADLLLARREAARAGRDGGEGIGSGGSSYGDRYASLPAAGDRVSSAVMGAYAQQYAGTGLGRSTVQTFAEIGLQRGVCDAYRKEGFSREDIGDAAKTTKALDWKNDRQAFDDLQRSTRPERAAIVEIDREKDHTKRGALIERKRRDLHIDDKPQDAQDRWNRNIDRVQHHHHDADQRHGVGASAKQADASLAAGRTQEHGKPAAAKVRVAKLEVGQSKTAGATAKQTLDDFGKTAASPVKVAEAKPASPGPKVG